MKRKFKIEYRWKGDSKYATKTYLVDANNEFEALDYFKNKYIGAYRYKDIEEVKCRPL